jgi:drug/metabolite transporter (DMT)-like permease
LSRTRAYLALATAISGTAWSAILVRWAGVPGTSAGFYRTLIAALVLVPWRLTHRRTPAPSGAAIALALVGGAFFALDLALYNTAILLTTAATAALLGNLTPIFVGLMTWIIMRRRPRAGFWMGLALSIAGCAAIVGSDALHGGDARNVFGDQLALFAAVFFAGYLVTTERVRTSMDTLTFNTLAIIGSVVTLLVICLLRHDALTGFPPRAWAALVALGFVSQLGLVYALGHLPATITSAGLLGQVPLTAMLAMVFLHEPLSLAQIAGGVIVLVGIYVVNRVEGGADSSSG